MKISSIAFNAIAIFSPLRFVVCGRSSPNQLKYRCHSSLCVWPNRGLGWCALEGWQLYVSDQKMCVPRCHDNRISVSCLEFRFFVFGFFSLICGENFGAIFFGLYVCCFHEWTFFFIFITFTQYWRWWVFSRYTNTIVQIAIYAYSPHNYFETNGRMSLYSADTDILSRSWFRFHTTLNHVMSRKWYGFSSFSVFLIMKKNTCTKYNVYYPILTLHFFILFYLWKNDFSS